MKFLRDFSRQYSAPFTAGLIATLSLSAVLSWLTPWSSALALRGSLFSRPWAVLTYPWANDALQTVGSLIWFVFAMVWLWVVGQKVESDIGSQKMGAFWAFFTVVPALLVSLAGTMANLNYGIIMGTFLPLSALTIVWCFRNPTYRVMLYGLLPVPAMLIALVTGLLVLVNYGMASPVFGILAAAPLSLAILFAQNKLPVSYSRTGGFGGRVHATRAQKSYDNKYYDDVRKREKEREERERLRKLFESSLDDK